MMIPTRRRKPVAVAALIPKNTQTLLRKTIAVVALLAAAVGYVVVTPGNGLAQGFEDVALFQEAINSNFFGVDARAMSMGNAGIVTARDGSALIFNPANLARIRRIEARGGFTHLRLANETQWFHNGSILDGERDLNKSRINAASLTMPVPTYRGSLVFAFGVHRINSFDRAFEVEIPDTIRPNYETSVGRELETGSMWKWSAGGAIDISPRLSVGGALHLLTGGDEYSWTREYMHVSNVQQNINLNNAIDIDYLGVGATAGLLYQVSPEFSTGFTVETPSFIQAEERFESVLDTNFSNYEWFETSFSEYSIRRPLTFAFGLAGQFERLTVAGDVRYRDWSQLDFNYEDDFLPDSREDQFIQDNLKESISLHLGGEYLFPDQGVSLRAGYYYDPLPISSDFIESNRQYFTVGGGFLIDRVMTVDVAFARGGYELRDFEPGDYFADYKTSRIFLTFAYRI
ncbi:MAG: hypothetical protein GF341_02820 [candidate division Zixibacteria bacterium]|nr:hypothetical protein [candidate division Zixibacteria bacterium]